MDIRKENASIKTVFLGVIFVVVGFACAFVLFEYLTKTDKITITATASSVSEEGPQTLEEFEPMPEVRPIESLQKEPEVVGVATEIAEVPMAEVPKEEISQPAEEEMATEGTDAEETTSEEAISEEATSEKEVPALVLNGIFASETSSYALINNRIVREGESILGVKVVHIYFNKVVLDAFGKELVLRVK